MKRLLTLLTPLCALLLCAGCGAAKEYSTAFFAMDTYMTMQSYGPHAEDAMAQAEQAVFALENQISRTRENTDISRLNAADGEPAAVSAEVYQLLADSQALCVPGVFDVTIAAVADLWGIHTENSRIPSPEEIAAALQTVGSGHLTLLADGTARLDRGTKIDLGAVGKGFAADRCAAILRENGVESGLIFLGGNIYAVGEKPDGSAWTIGVADPDVPSSYIATVEVRDTSVVTTGDYERYFMQDGVRYHHVLDPATGAPARSGLRSVTVVHENSTLADARSTTLFVLGLEKGLQFCAENGLDAIFITENKEVYVTEGLRSRFSFCGEEAGYVLAS